MTEHKAPALGHPRSATQSRNRARLKKLGFLCVALLLYGAGLQSAQAVPASPTGPQEPAAARDGQHDFDFNFGTWKTHIRRVLDPLSGSTNSIELNGTVIIRPVWGGRAQLEEIEADGPKGHWEGLSLRLYNPQAHQWGQYFINSKIATLGPPLIGSFKNGRCELFSSDDDNGRSILVRGTWSDITPNSHRYGEDYSADGGKTWAPAFQAELTRVSETADEAAVPEMEAGGEGHEFDFDFGHWRTHSTRLLHPLTGSTDWINMDGGTNVTKVWGGRANLAEYKATGPTGPIELIALRWYNRTAHQWYIDFAMPNVGTLGIPGIGEFKNGRADFYDYEPINGKSVLVRFSIWGITRDTAQSEQAFSEDGGKTWEVNWINKYTRAKAE
jgi:hypothetical protein